MPDHGTDLFKLIERELWRLLPCCEPDSQFVNSAIRDAIFPGGKRLRPVLTILGAQVFGRSGAEVMSAACAVEFVHASSMIIDDLPCMDDADMRRGNPALHLVYGEDIALLASLALLNQSYAIFGRTPALIREATECIGVAGMIGGQAIDLTPDGGGASMQERNRKTSALIRLAAVAGALAAGVPCTDAAALGEFGYRLGEAYQMYDDMRDSGAPSSSTGKTAGQDRRHRRMSHASLPDTQCFAELTGKIEEARGCLVDAYGAGAGTAGLLRFIDKIFASASVRTHAAAGD
jgi:geranylgeranyl diphosphate synthase type II